MDTFGAGFEKRCCADKIINNKRKQLWQFLSHYGLVALNDSTNRDEDGNHTFISSAGH